MHDASDAQGDGAGDGEWLTYQQIGDRRGISLRAAVRMTQRQGLRRQPGNDGKVRIFVPCDMLEPARRASQGPSHRPARNDSAGDEAALVAALQAAFQATLEAKDATIAAQAGQVEALQGQVASLRNEVDRAQAEIQEAKAAAIRAELAAGVSQERLTQVEAEASELRTRLEAAESAVASAEHDKASATLVAEELVKQAAERKARSLLRRLQDAWKGQ